MIPRDTRTPDQLGFDFLMTIPERQLLVHPKKVAEVLHYERSYVYDLIADGTLEAHRGLGGERKHLRVTRRSVLAYFARTAEYLPDDFIEVIVKLARTLTPAQRKVLIERLLSGSSR
jgi:excisionase family DNA binding protein